MRLLIIVQLLGATGQDTSVAEAEEDLDRVTEENKVLKSRYENAIEVNVHYIEISNLPYVFCACTLS